MAGKVKVKAPKPDWAPPKVNKSGQQVDDDGLPLAPAARAIALAEAGRKSDPAGIVTSDMISAHDPKAAQADREAIAAFHAGEADADETEMEPTPDAAPAADQG